MNNWENRTIIITGAGAKRGIGRQLCRDLAKSEAFVIAIDKQSDQVEEVRAELESIGAPSAGYVVDVTNETGVTELFKSIKHNHPAIYGLVNLAGVPSPQPLLEISTEEWERTFDVNVKGTFLMIREAAKAMLEQKTGGRIVNTSSITALDGGGTFSKAAYAAAKAAVLGLTRGAARELGRGGITVNCLVPGPIDTDIMGGALSDERKASMSETIPLGRVGTTEEVAALIQFLLSDKAGFITGAAISIDGGKHMH